jgi:hypothetical protein
MRPGCETYRARTHDVRHDEPVFHPTELTPLDAGTWNDDMWSIQGILPQVRHIRMAEVADPDIVMTDFDTFEDLGGR